MGKEALSRVGISIVHLLQFLPAKSIEPAAHGEVVFGIPDAFQDALNLRMFGTDAIDFAPNGVSKFKEELTGSLEVELGCKKRILLEFYIDCIGYFTDIGLHCRGGGANGFSGLKTLHEFVVTLVEALTVFGGGIAGDMPSPAQAAVIAPDRGFGAGLQHLGGIVTDEVIGFCLGLEEHFGAVAGYAVVMVLGGFHLYFS